MESIISKEGRTFWVERYDNLVFVAADAITGFGSQLFVHEAMKNSKLKFANLWRNIVVGDFMVLGVGYKLPFFSREAAMDRVRETIQNYEHISLE